MAKRKDGEFLVTGRTAGSEAEGEGGPLVEDGGTFFLQVGPMS